MSKFQYFRDGDRVTRYESPVSDWLSEGKERLSAKEGESLYVEQVRADLLSRIRPGQKVYTILRHVSSSGMSRDISLCIVENGQIQSIDYSVSVLTGYNLSKKRHGLTIGGAGMDMGFALVYALGAALWPDGTPEPHGTRNGTPDSDGGYALKHHWL